MAEFEPIAGQDDSSSQIQAETLVVGGGIAGMTAAIETAEIGKKVLLVERNPSLGGRVAASHQYFPKLCPPTCGMEINLKRMRSNSNVRILTLAEVEKVSGSAGDYEVQIKLNPRYVNDKCTCCGECEKACEIERDNDFNYGIDKTKAIYLPHLMAYPQRYVVDPKYAGDERMKKCVDACEYGAIELDMQPRTIAAKVGAIIWATGWKPYDATKLDTLGFGKYPNVITNVMMERYASVNGPTGGKVARPSDGKDITKIGFVQCAGSRDENHLPYCSAICCLASMKQATYVRERYPDAEVHMFYIDVRAPGRLEDFYTKVQDDEKFFFHRGKVAKITENPDNQNVILEAENTLTGDITKMEVDLAVLATGMVPNTADEPPPLDTPLDEFGFIAPDTGKGVIGAGVAMRPYDVSASAQDATGAALKAINVEGRR
ncbi:MAG: CoB--CoM heterodisulfide reductase iron-sulfur subunit A family protein [Candidatus Latescibacterota bacterium]|nr:MAG: CoB--CoM heterodisulfide reductase iron-sulfur subunit A family protein [Candidatus Latescibacterota bacterium]